jgi:hypothetical protein
MNIASLYTVSNRVITEYLDNAVCASGKENQLLSSFTRQDTKYKNKLVTSDDNFVSENQTTKS